MKKLGWSGRLITGCLVLSLSTTPSALAASKNNAGSTQDPKVQSVLLGGMILSTGAAVASGWFLFDESTRRALVPPVLQELLPVLVAPSPLAPSKPAQQRPVQRQSYTPSQQQYYPAAPAPAPAPADDAGLRRSRA